MQYTFDIYYLEEKNFQTNFGSSMTVTVSNFTKTPLSAVRTSTTAGEVNKSSHLKTYFYFKYVQIEVPQCDVRPLGKESLLCKRITKPAPK